MGSVPQEPSPQPFCTLTILLLAGWMARIRFARSSNRKRGTYRNSCGGNSCSPLLVIKFWNATPCAVSDCRLKECALRQKDIHCVCSVCVVYSGGGNPSLYAIKVHAKFKDPSQHKKICHIINLAYHGASMQSFHRHWPTHRQMLTQFSLSPDLLLLRLSSAQNVYFNMNPNWGFYLCTSLVYNTRWLYLKQRRPVLCYQLYSGLLLFLRLAALRDLSFFLFYVFWL